MSETEVLNDSPEANLEAGVTDTEEGKKEPPKRTLLETFAFILGGAAVGTSVTAIAIVGGPVVISAGVLSSLIGPYVFYQQKQLTEIALLKETHEAIMNEVNNLTKENERLEKLIKELTDTVGKLEDVEAALDVLTATQGESVAEFRKQVVENKKILAKMEKNLKGNVLQNMLSVVVRSDKDGDFKIDADELEELIQRISEIQGVTLYEDRFRQKIQESGGSLKAVMAVVRSLLMDEDAGAEPIFTLSES